ncbi:MAG: ubiquinone/menaquinone biosynthesis methyltransferase, partial [Nitrospinaceae bacterium]|nr:ubiquinone/menaquinone biosynthesis methyltransferase [Nitrospinaceae bacterium]NIR54131.1 ubiquinone/menaquinone biosynthesis methyltransferase [Nitrospinaceae bacterium]NIS84544.1 ubiquinone/menaquinone biosynthesis methyltransferase [Nitrospinaceae bacterium]NIT81336.1 ubiquinone/menaquinone biosynthesis methyltransferase [Nitrospinaceae bacterium]NIU43624.1 ubiquinone/menaquinone biosynthesis methyltransferase [Nitrospinaceae bacterium]
YWRKAAVDWLDPQGHQRILDVATGTADVALEIASRVSGPLRVVGLDFSRPMLALGRKKVREENLDPTIVLHPGCGQHLPFSEASFDGVVTAFGIRNFTDVDAGLAEMHRVLKPGGRAVILEFSRPRNPVLAGMYRFYFHAVLPRVGRWVSGHPQAYQYLPDSVAQFPTREAFSRRMQNARFRVVEYRDLTFGIVTLYRGTKDD